MKGQIFWNKYKQILPLLMLAIYCAGIIQTVISGVVEIEGEMYPYILDIRQYLGIAAVIVGFISFMFFRKYYKYVLILTLFMGIFNLIVFSAFISTQSFSFNSLTVSFQPSAFYATCLAALLNLRRLSNAVVSRFFSEKTNEEMKQDHSDRHAEDVKRFKEMFKLRSKEELIEIIADQRFTPAAREAAEQLLTEKQ